MLAEETSARVCIALVFVALIYFREVLAPGSEVRLFKEAAIIDGFLNLLV